MNIWLTNKTSRRKKKESDENEKPIGRPTDICLSNWPAAFHWKSLERNIRNTWNEKSALDHDENTRMK